MTHTLAPTATFETRDPATSEVLASVPRCSAADVDTAVRRAHAEQGTWAALTPAERGRVLIAYADLLAAHADELIQMETLDVGKPLHESAVDVRGAEALLRFFGEVAGKAPTDKFTVDGGLAFTD